MADTNLYLYPVWTKSDAATWKKVLSLLISRHVINSTGEGQEGGEVWFSPGSRPEHLLKGGEKESFEDCRSHCGSAYFIPDGDTGDFGASCPACSARLDDALVAEAIVDFNEADSEDDRQNCPKCGALLDVPKLKMKVPTALAPAFLCFLAVASATPNPELMKGLEEATGTPWKSLTEAVAL